MAWVTEGLPIATAAAFSCSSEVFVVASSSPARALAGPVLAGALGAYAGPEEDEEPPERLEKSFNLSGVETLAK